MAYDRDHELAARKLIGARIRAARGAMSQTRLAAVLERPQSIVSEWEGGHRRIRYGELWELAAALKVTVAQLVGPPATPKEHHLFDRLVTEMRSLRDAHRAAGGPTSARGRQDD